MPLDTYRRAHEGMVIACHDIMVFLEEKQAWLLVKRKNEPAKDILWPLGGRIQRGMDTSASAIKKVNEESRLEVTDIQSVGFARTYFKTDPFGHGRGTDSLNVLFVAKARGSFQLDKLHEEPHFIDRAAYTQAFEDSLHPYVRDFFVEAWKYLRL